MGRLRPAQPVKASHEAVPHLEAVSNRIPNRKPSWLDFRGCGEKKDWVSHPHGRTVRGRENSVASDKDPGCDVETARCLGSLVLGSAGAMEAIAGCLWG